MKELLVIQSQLKAPKSQYNNFGHYNYRSCEDILEAVKPLLLEQKCVLILSDEVKEVGSRYHIIANDEKKGTHIDYDGTRVYVEATATIINEAGDKISVKALAREEVVKAGMDASQITGAASSYARKYALNGLFAIDDNKDSDTTNTHKATANASTSAKPSTKPSATTTPKATPTATTSATPKATPAATPTATPSATATLSDKIEQDLCNQAMAINDLKELSAFYKSAPAAYQRQSSKFYQTVIARSVELQG